MEGREGMVYKEGEMNVMGWELFGRRAVRKGRWEGGV